jgi:hypothetical protein
VDPLVPRRLALLVLGAFVATAAAAVAGSDPGKEQVRLVAADQAAARAAVLRLQDLGEGWTGGPKKPSLSSKPPCTNWQPKQSDLVLTGAAEADFKHPGLEIDSGAQVLRTARMVQLDWQRTAVAPGLVGCLRSFLQKQSSADAKVVSVHRLAFARVPGADYTAAYRVEIDVRASGTTVPIYSDVVLVGRGRTEIDLTVTAPAAAASAVGAAERKLAGLLAQRARA